MLREKLWAYLKAEGVEHNEHSCRCPTPDCGGRAAIRCAAEGTLQPLPAWHCPVCGRGGDTVDAALALHPQLDESGAIRQVRRALHLPITHLDSISAEELMGMRFKRKHWLIENLLGPGLYLLAGPSKIGKSWMVLYMADRISRGEPVWDMRSTRSEVLYISLEDTPERLQKRLQAITERS